MNEFTHPDLKTGPSSDLAALKHIAGLDVATGLHHTAGSESLYVKLLHKLADHHGGDAEKLQAALQQRDDRQALCLAHTLKAAAGTLGAVELQEAARLAETAVRQADRTKAQQYADSVAELLPALLKAIQEALHPAPAGPASRSAAGPVPNKELPVILVVDDAEMNIETLTELLGGTYALRAATNGRSALQLAQECLPDLILLDILMPDMDGFEVCRLLKAQPGLRDIPVIFISALEDVEEKVKAFRSGGVDYLTKPFQPEELMARVATHLTLRSLQTELELKNNHLDQIVRERTRELAAAHQRLTIADQAKNEFLQLISHELRTPTNGVLGIADLAFEAGRGSAEIDELQPLFTEARDRMINVLDDALLLAQIHVSNKQFSSAPVRIDQLLPRTISVAAQAAALRGVRITMAPASTTVIDGDEILFETAFLSLLQTTLAFTDRGERIAITCREESSHMTICLQGRGKTLPPEEAEAFFKVFGVTRNETYAEKLGLKPAVAERIISLFGGSVRICGIEERGVRIVITLPKRDQASSRDHRLPYSSRRAG